ncbi:hypothetical protein H6F67_16320 [Microcoleus sp. FACHB-1515]|uniref:hypothetical protein n=1 Tax=Cyanophyceae TaxID=3028117 RepID=UPI00168854D2|nr:hypothetical protein [Microcoleus sp. FACHB-1515]MBD2091409.1 hypothetical protein [Microcoleus sp. FACHB-1515]
MKPGKRWVGRADLPTFDRRTTAPAIAALLVATAAIAGFYQHTIVGWYFEEQGIDRLHSQI